MQLAQQHMCEIHKQEVLQHHNNWNQLQWLKKIKSNLEFESIN
jgi:hypothetical protein